MRNATIPSFREQPSPTPAESVMIKSDIEALESMSFADNYNGYIFGKISQYIPSKKVVDFGAGYGTFARYLQKNDFQVTGVEINDKAISVLESYGIESQKNIADVEGKVEVITSLNTLEHIEDDVAVMHALHEKLEEGGLLLLYLPASMLIWTQLDDMVCHYRRYSKRELESKLVQSNFVIEASYYVDFIGWLTLLTSKVLRLNLGFDRRKIIFYDRFIFRPFRFLDVFLSRIIGKNLLVVARKK